MSYQVLVDDNFHYMDPDHRSDGVHFATLEEALGHCRRLVDESLVSTYSFGMPCYELLTQHFLFGEDPFVTGGEGGVPFSARDYATESVREAYGDWQVEHCKRDAPGVSRLVSILLAPVVWWRIRRRLRPRATSSQPGRG